MRRHLPSVEALNQKDAARVAGIDLETFKKMAQRDPEGAPPRLPDGTYPLEALGAWIKARERPQVGGRLDPAHERARKDKELADRTAMENQVRRGELIEAAEVVAAGQDMVLRVRARLLRLPDAATPLVDGVDDPAHVRRVLDDMVRDALTELSGEWG